MQSLYLFLVVHACWCMHWAVIGVMLLQIYAHPVASARPVIALGAPCRPMQPKVCVSMLGMTT